MDIDRIKRQLARPATRFFAGGFRPAGTDEESWIGRVFLFADGEDVPLDASGAAMVPLLQLHLPTLPVVPAALQGIRVLTIFISAQLPEVLEPMGANWLVREYAADAPLQRRVLPPADGQGLAPFPLRAERVDEDYPLWDGGGVPWALAEEILTLEDAGRITGYYDVTCHAYEHKLGGWPSFCQSGIDPGEGFEFMLQVSSDDKVGLNVVDNGSLMFWRHRDSGEWALYYDFH